MDLQFNIYLFGFSTGKPFVDLQMFSWFWDSRIAQKTKRNKFFLLIFWRTISLTCLYSHSRPFWLLCVELLLFSGVRMKRRTLCAMCRAKQKRPELSKFGRQTIEWVLLGDKNGKSKARVNRRSSPGQWTGMDKKETGHAFRLSNITSHTMFVAFLNKSYVISKVIQCQWHLCLYL